jgi:hypothetical protein
VSVPNLLRVKDGSLFGLRPLEGHLHRRPLDCRLIDLNRSSERAIGVSGNSPSGEGTLKERLRESMRVIDHGKGESRS